MLFQLADAPPPDSGFLYQAALLFAFVASAGANLVQWMRGKAVQRRELTNDPLYIAAHPEFMTKTAHDSEIKRIQAERTQNVADLKTMIADMRNALHEDMEEFRDSIKEMWGRINGHAEKIANHGERLATLEARIPTQPIKPR